MITVVNGNSLSDSSFDQAIAVVLSPGHEGLEFTNTPGDLGGPTKAGITLRTYQAYYPYAIVDDLKNLTLAQIKEFYYKNFWLKAPYPQIADSSIRNYVFDMHVNMGLGNAVKCLQRSVWALEVGQPRALDDGVLGTDTLSLTNKHGSSLLPSVRAERASHHRIRTIKDLSQLKFLDGWLRRTYGF
jgi:lysozyme family protein